MNSTFTGTTDFATYSPSLFITSIPLSGNEVINYTFAHVEDFKQLGHPVSTTFPLGFDFKYCNIYNFERTGGRGDFTTDVDTMNILFGDPLFVDALNDDFHLQDTSPLIGAGTSTCVLATDFCRSCHTNCWYF